MPALPFTRAQFLAVFAGYNEAVWPIQVVAVALGLAMLALVLMPSPRGDRLIAAGLAAMWVWTGLGYHALHFSTVNKAAWIFAAMFVLQGLLFVRVAVRGGLAFRSGRTPAQRLGWVLVMYAFAVYPLIGLWLGHRSVDMPMFGITPCPVTLFTFGLLLMAPSVHRGLLVVPLLWSLVGGSAAFLLDMPQDWPLLFAGMAAVSALAWQHRTPIAIEREGLPIARDTRKGRSRPR
jgi:hypothetical protein